MNKKLILAKKHNSYRNTLFTTKTCLLSAQRMLKNALEGNKKFPDKKALIDLPIISASESYLWNADDQEDNWILTAGKIQNLRLAARNINGVEIPAGEIFSFWKYIGNPNFGKRFVTGREVKEGCIVPTKGGGLCQLSNALYDAALKADFQIIERHRHSQVIAGSLAEKNRDATVKWNYIDLRFRSNFPFRIEVQMTDSRLMVVFKSSQKNNPELNTNYKEFFKASSINDCYSCGNKACILHNGKEKIKNTGKVTYILDEKWIEYEKYLESVINENDVVLLPFTPENKLKNSKNCWNLKGKNIQTCSIPSLRRILNFKIHKGKNPFELALAEDQKICRKMAKLIPIESTHLVVSQNLLPFLYKDFHTAGRTLDVLMYRLPIEILQKKLDVAFSTYSESPTLHDFRASASIWSLENEALKQARKIITPHTQIAKLFPSKSHLLTWHIPQKKIHKSPEGKKILFPASSLGRKGAYEMRKLITELGLPVVIAGKAIEKNDFWKNIEVEFADNDNLFHNIALLVYPAYIEHHPQLLLEAISLDIPMIITEACGIEPGKNITVVPTGNYAELKKEVSKFLSLHPIFQSF